MDKNLLNEVYKEVWDAVGEDNMLYIYKLFKGQQVTFPMRLYNSKMIREAIIKEYDGGNISALACEYGYSERSIRRMLNEAAREKQSTNEQ